MAHWILYNVNMVLAHDSKFTMVHITQRILPVLMLSAVLIRSQPVVVSGGPENDYESWIMRTNDYRLMVIFCRNPDWQSGDLYVTFSWDEGVTWDTPAPIIESPGDQATLSFLQLPGDTFRLWYASNENGAYGIFAAHSTDGLSWDRDGPINLGWGPSDMHYDPTVIIEEDSSLTMSYRGPDGAYIAHKPYGDDWDTLRTMVNISGYRPRIMKHTNGNYLCAYHRNTYPGYEVFVRTSLDRINWTPEVRLTFAGNSHDPFPCQTLYDSYLIYYATYIPPAYNIYRRYSYDTINWSIEEQFTFDATNNTQPHCIVEDNYIYIVWAHAVSFPDDHDVYFERTYFSGIHETTSFPNQRHPIHLKVYPNPCAKYIRAVVPVSMQETVEFKIYDAQGRMIQDIPNINRIGSDAYSIETAQLLPGVYFLQGRTTSVNYHTRFVVAR